MQQEQKKSEPQTESRNLHHEDLALKTAAQYFGEELMPLLGITGKAKYVAPTELIKLEARQMYQDFNYVSADNTWIHLEIESDSIDCVVFTSASTVKGFVESTGLLDYSKVTAACIGKQTKAAADDYGMQTYMSEKATIDSLVELVVKIKNR